VKTSCPPAENVNETTAMLLQVIPKILYNPKNKKHLMAPFRRQLILLSQYIFNIKEAKK